MLQQARKRRKELSEEIKTLKKRIKALEVKLPKLSMEISGCDTTRDNLTNQIPELRSQSELSKADAAKLVELNRKVHKCKTDMSSCAMLASKLEAEVARLQKAILDAGGSKLKKQEAACKKVLTDLNNAEKALNTAKVSITSMEKAAMKARETKAAAEEQLEQCKVTLEEKNAEFKALEEDAFKVMQAFENVKVVEAEKREALEAVSKEVEDLKKSQSKVKVVEIELIGKVEAYDKQIKESEANQQKWNDQIAKLRTAAEEDDDLDLSDDEAEDEQPPRKTIEDDDDDEEMEDAENAKGNSEEADASSDKPEVKAPKSSLPTLSYAALEKYDRNEVKADIEVLETERNTIAKNANMGAIAEYRKKEADYLAR